MSQSDLPLPQLRGFGETSRTDKWWVVPVLVFLGLSAFIVYSTWAAFQGAHFYVAAGGAHYLSPMYSPVFFDVPGNISGHALFGEKPEWLLWPNWLVFSPAFFILWAPAGFRFTCYYYRGAYYKAFWGDPVTCAVGEPGFRGKKFRGENSFPLIMQNLHRYFFYIAVIFIGILSYDGIISYVWTDPDTGNKTFGMGIGSIVLTINPILLGAYTFGCHSMRHLIAGKFNVFSKHKARKKCYDCVSALNKRHMLLAWMSLFWVGFTDFYIRMVSMGVWTDWRIF